MARKRLAIDQIDAVVQVRYAGQVGGGEVSVFDAGDLFDQRRAGKLLRHMAVLAALRGGAVVGFIGDEGVVFAIDAVAPLLEGGLFIDEALVPARADLAYRKPD